MKTEAMKFPFTQTLSLLCILVMSAFEVFGQVVAPAPPQSQPIALVGATAHIGNGEIIERSVIIIIDGKISEVLSATDVDRRIEGYKIIEVGGMHAYPGLILPNSELGLSEISAVRATIDRAERGGLNPNVRSIIAYNTDSEIIPTMRFNGILMAQVAPVGGLISGSSSMVQLDAWNWEDAAFKVDEGIYLNWPSKLLPARWWLGETEPRKNENYDKNLRDLTKLMTDAHAYASGNAQDQNLKLAAMQGLFDGSKALYIRVNQAGSILQSVQLANTLGVKRIVVVGGSEALMVKDFLKENDIPVIIGQVHRLPGRSHRDVYLPYKLPGLLHEAGVKVALSYSGRSSSARNLPFVAGTVAAYGLDKETALQMITANSAQILGIDDRVGTIEAGKDATLIISSGDILDMMGNDMQYAFIQGRQVSLNNKQQVLFQKYKQKYDNSQE